MCNTNHSNQNEIFQLGLNLISTAIEASLRGNQEQNSDVLAAATTAYQRGHITKNQYLAVINAMDKSVGPTRANTVPNRDNSWNQEYLEAHRYLNRFRR